MTTGSPGAHANGRRVERRRSLTDCDRAHYFARTEEHAVPGTAREVDLLELVFATDAVRRMSGAAKRLDGEISEMLAGTAAQARSMPVPAIFLNLLREQMLEICERRGGAAWGMAI